MPVSNILFHYERILFLYTGDFYKLRIFLLLFFQIGDQILAVNEMSTKDLTHTEVVAMLKDTSASVILTVTHGKTFSL